MACAREIISPVTLSLLAALCLCAAVRDEDVENQTTERREYCKRDIFNATCPPGMVIIMKLARYGRMAIGRCLKTGVGGNMGCAANVIPYLDNKCSGRRTCSVPVFDIIKIGHTPCPDELASYFEAAYECLKVTTAKPSTCDHVPRMTQVPVDGGILELHQSNQVTCPWSVHAAPGQTINVTLYDFGSHGDRRGSGVMCHRFAVIKESETGRDTNICSGHERVRSVYLSDGHVIYIQPITAKSQSHSTGDYYLLKFSALGCPTPSLPYPYHVSRKDASLIVSCNATREMWNQACDDGKWIGIIGNCTDGRAEKNTWGIFSRGWTSPFGIIVVVGLGVVLGVLFGILLLSLAVCVLKRRRKPAVPGCRPFMEEVYQEPRPSETDELRMFDAHTFRRASYTEHLWKNTGAPPSMTSTDRAPSSGYQTITSGSCASSYHTGNTFLSSPAGDLKGHSPKIRAKVQTIVHA